jgi:hypothetical protein
MEWETHSCATQCARPVAGLKVAAPNTEHDNKPYHNGGHHIRVKHWLHTHTGTQPLMSTVRDFSRTDRTVQRYSVPPLLDEDGMTAGDGRGLPGTAETPSPADIHRPWPISTVPGRHQVFRCSIWLDMSEPTVMDRVYCR